MSVGRSSESSRPERDSVEMSGPGVSAHRATFQRFLEELRQTLGDRVEAVILFGSVARGEEGEGSDVDVLIIVEDEGVREEVFEVSYRIMLDTDIYISPKVISSEEFRRMGRSDSPFLQAIEPEMQVYGSA